MFSGLRLIHFLLHTKSNLMKSKIAMKIAAGFISVIALMILMLWISRVGYNNILGNVNNLETLAAKQITAGNLRFKTAQLLMAVNDYILTGEDNYREDYARHEARIDTHTVKLQMQKLEPIEKRILASILLNIDTIRSISKRVFEISNPRTSNEAVVLMKSMDYDYGEEVNRKTTELFDHISRRIDEEREIVEHVKARTAIIHAFVLVLGSLISLIVTYLVMTRIAKPIVTVSQAANALAKGDYSYRPTVKTHDEVADLAQSFCTMADDIQQSHRTLEHAKRLNESIVHSIPPGIILFDTEAQIISVNKRIEELFNIELGQFAGAQAEVFLEHIGVMEECRETIHARKPVRDLECRCDCPRRGEMWLSLTLTPFTVRTEWNGEYHQYVLVVNDITERRSALKLLEESERRISTLMRNLPGMAYRCKNDPDWTMEFASDGCYNLTGYPSEALLYNTQMSFNDIIHPEDRARIWDVVQAKIGERQSYTLIYRIHTADGQMKWVWEQGQGVYDADGNLSFLEGFVTDITDQRLAEEELRKSQTLLSTMFDTSRDGILLEDRNGMIVYANKAFAEIYGFESPSELTGIPISTVQSEQDNPRMTEYGQRRLKGEPAPTLYEFKGKKKDGTLIDLEVSVSTAIVGDEFYIVSLVRDIAERKHAEQKINFQANLLSVVGNAVIATDMQGRVTYWNPAAEKLYGWSIGEALGRQIVELTPTEQSREHAQEIMDHLSQGESWSGEFPVRRKDGSEFIAFVFDNPIVDADGNLTGVIGISNDITDRKQTEEILRESEERYRLLFEQSIEAIYLCDVKTLRIREANSAFMHLLGYSEDEVRSLTLFDLVAEDRKSIQRVLDRLSTEGSFIIGERRWKRKDGNVVNVEVTVSTFLQQGERTLYVIARDITERKKAESELRENEQRYRSVVESLTQAYYETDRRGVFTYFNPGLLLIGGYGEEELLGTSSFRRVVPEHRSRVIEAYLQWIKNRRTDMSIEFIVQTKSGRRFWVEQASHFTYDNNGNFVKATNTLRDIDERKLAEQKLQEMNTQLELALKYQELFIANMTHEIRTPLNVILGYTGYIMDIGAQKFSQEEAEFFESIEGAGKRLMRTVDNVLQMTSFQTGLIKINLQRQDVSPSVRSIVREMQCQASEKGLALEVGALEEPLHAVIDRYALEQALVNLIDNAIKYTNAGGIVVNLKRIEDHAHIEVHDTGIGISEEFLPKIFAAFTQESTGYTRAYQGLGLGLSLVKNYISATGGTIFVQSKKGEGSTFSIVFPLA